jgi:hypothetical protein
MPLDNLEQHVRRGRTGPQAERVRLALTLRDERRTSRDESQATGMTLYSYPQPVLLPHDEHV